MRVRLRLGAKFLGFCFFLVPVFFLHYSLSKSRSESTIRGNPNVARWTSWEPADALPKECDNAWQEQPDADSFRASLGGTETGALILPWLDEEHIITSPSKIICGWVVVKGVRGHFTVQGQAYSGRRREDTPTATGPFSEDLTNLNSTPDFPPDGILIRAIGIQNGFESTMDVSETFAAFEYDRIEYRLYHTTIKLRDADKYKLEVLLEYRSIENLGNLRSVVAPPLQLPTIVSKDGQTLLHTIQIPGKRISRSTYLGLPHCMGADHAGRWVNASFLEKSAGAASWASDEEEVHEDLSEPLESYDGRVWVPYECRYRRWTHKAFKNKCLAKWHNLTHWIGDSNIKRSLKAVTTGGAWCREWYDEGSPECQCEDKALVVPQISENVPSWNLISNVAGKSDVTMLYASLKSLNPSAHKSWSWTDTQDLKADLQNSGSYPAVIELDYPSMVILNLPTADMLPLSKTLTKHLESFQSLAMQLQPYSHRGIPIVIRTPQYAATATRSRTTILSRFFIQSFVAALQHTTSVHVWDVHHLSEQAIMPAQARLAKCAQGHATRDLVDWENLMLMNLMCNQRLTDAKLSRG